MEASRILSQATTNPDVLRKNDAAIREAERSISYFEDTLRELQARKAAAVASGVGVLMPVYAAAGGGGVLVDVDGNSLIDLGSGIAVTTIGNADPAVAAAVADQATRMIHTCFTITGYEGYLEVAERLAGEGVAARVVSLPNWRRFEAQDEAYRTSVLPNAEPERILRVSIEAGTTFGWERLVMAKGLKFGLDGFGASAPAKDLYDHFGLTADHITPKIMEAIRA